MFVHWPALKNHVVWSWKNKGKKFIAHLILYFTTVQMDALHILTVDITEWHKLFLYFLPMQYCFFVLWVLIFKFDMSVLFLGWEERFPCFITFVSLSCITVKRNVSFSITSSWWCFQTLHTVYSQLSQLPMWHFLPSILSTWEVKQYHYTAHMR